MRSGKGIMITLHRKVTLKVKKIIICLSSLRLQPAVNLLSFKLKPFPLFPWFSSGLGLSQHNYIVIIWFSQNLCQSKCPMRKQVQLSFSFPSSETDNQRNSYLYSLSVKLLVKTIFSSPPTTYFAKFQDFRNKTKAVVEKPCQLWQSTHNIPTNIW